MEKIYEPINWEAFPSIKTPVNLERLNKIDSAINALDDRIVEMSGKADMDASDIALNRQTLGYVKKNLFNVNDKYNGASFRPAATVSADGWVTDTYDNSSGTSLVYLNYYTRISDNLSTDTDYLIVTENESNVPVYAISNSGETDISQFTSTLKVTSNTTDFTVKTTRSDFSNSTKMLRTFVEVPAGTKATVKFRISVLADTTVTTDSFNYEPYVDDVDTRLKKVETEVMPIERGGTGATTAKEARNNLLKDMLTVTSDVVDDSYFIGAYTSMNGANGAAYKRTALSLWNYIKFKIEGITVTNLLATVAGKPLDATMGKALDDKITDIINSITWKYVGTSVGSAELALPDNWKELKIILVLNDGNGLKIPIEIISEMVAFGSYGVPFMVTGNTAGTSFIRGRVLVKESTINIANIYIGPIDTPSDALLTTHLHAWYK